MPEINVHSFIHSFKSQTPT